MAQVARTARRDKGTTATMRILEEGVRALEVSAGNDAADGFNPYLDILPRILTECARPGGEDWVDTSGRAGVGMGAAGRGVVGFDGAGHPKDIVLCVAHNTKRRENESFTRALEDGIVTKTRGYVSILKLEESPEVDAFASSELIRSAVIKMLAEKDELLRKRKFEQEEARRRRELKQASAASTAQHAQQQHPHQHQHQQQAPANFLDVVRLRASRHGGHHAPSLPNSHSQSSRHGARVPVPSIPSVAPLSVALSGKPARLRTRYDTTDAELEMLRKMVQRASKDSRSDSRQRRASSFGFDEEGILSYSQGSKSVLDLLPKRRPSMLRRRIPNIPVPLPPPMRRQRMTVRFAETKEESEEEELAIEDAEVQSAAKFALAMLSQTAEIEGYGDGQFKMVEISHAQRRSSEMGGDGRMYTLDLIVENPDGSGLSTYSVSVTALAEGGLRLDGVEDKGPLLAGITPMRPQERTATARRLLRRRHTAGIRLTKSADVTDVVDTDPLQRDFAAEEQSEDVVQDVPTDPTYNMFHIQGLFSIVKQKPAQVLEKKFQELDSGKQRRITIEELREKMIDEASEVQIQQMLNIFDLNGTGSIEPDEFVVVASLNDRLTGYNRGGTHIKSTALDLDLRLLEKYIGAYKDLFAIIDQDQDGHLGDTDLMVMMSASVGIELGTDRDLIEQIKALVDTNKDGVIDFMEFLRYIPFFLKIHQNAVDDPLSLDAAEKGRKLIHRIVRRRDHKVAASKRRMTQ